MKVVYQDPQTTKWCLLEGVHQGVHLLVEQGGGGGGGEGGIYWMKWKRGCPNTEVEHLWKRGMLRCGVGIVVAYKGYAANGAVVSVVVFLSLLGCQKGLLSARSLTGH